jgi:branched-chain amino acid transport system ATP-binding protein
MRNWLLKEDMLVKRAFSILHLLGIEHMWNERAMNLNGGQLKLLEIGRALMCQKNLCVRKTYVSDKTCYYG